MESFRAFLVTDDSIFIPVDYEDGSHRINVYAKQTGQLQQSLAFPAPIFYVPIIADNKLLVVAESELLALDLTSYEEIWSVQFSSLSIPTIAGQTVVFGFTDVTSQFSSTGLGIAGVDISSGDKIFGSLAASWQKIQEIS